MLDANENKDMSIHVEVKGLDKLIKKLGGITEELDDTLQAAGEESGKMLLAEEGLQKYPPETDANRPPAPYYERGRGMWTSETVNSGGSERLGTRWTVEREGKTATKIGNSATYAPFVHGAEQAWFMASKGWNKLYDTAVVKQSEIQRIYQAWIDRLIKKTT